MSSSSSSSPRSMLTIIIIALLSVFMISTVNAYDPDPLQDFCVAVNDSMSGGVFVNGRFCKDPKTVTPDDFFFSGLVKADDEYKTGPTRSKVTRVNVEQLRGLNTLGIAISRIDYAPAGFRPPHVHPRSAEILHVIKGKLYAGFITSNPPDPNDSNKLYAKILGPGDVYCFPRGLVHFHYNLGGEDAVAFSTQGSQNAGVVTIATTVFGSDPPVNPDLLATSFQLNKTKILDLQSKEWTGYT